MNLTDVRTVKALLKKYNLRPNKILGQHFLVSGRVLQEIIRASSLTKSDTVLEAGPGLGVLTQELAKFAKRVVAVEKDRALLPLLRGVLAEYKNVEITHGDILKFQDARHKIQDTNYKIVADIPYYLTSRLLRTFLETPYQPSLMVLLMQKEVAQRICQKAPNATLLSNAVQYYAKPKIVFRVPKTAFFPKPKVESVIIKLETSRKYDEGFDKKLFLLLKKSFSSPRKQLFSNLSRFYAKNMLKKCLIKANIEQSQRPQEVSIEKWIKLTKALEASI